MKINFSQFKNADKTLLIVIAVLAVFGLIMLSSASVAVGLNRFNDGSFYIKKQLIALVIGLAGLYYAYRVDYRRWRDLSFWLFAITLGLLVLVLIPGIGASGYGAQRWLNLYVTTFQPSELAKLTLILYLSGWLAEQGQARLRDFKTGLLPLLLLLGVLFLLIILQPDLGTLLVICAIAMVLYFVGGANLRHLAGLIGSGLILVALVIKLEPYRLARFTTFLNPGADPQGAGYHITQALLAIGSGGILGVGLGHSRQKFLYLPEVTGDSIFAVMAEELGFIACVALVALFALFMWRGLRIARRAPDMYGKLLAVGITAWIVIQAFVNIGAMVGVLPLTGLPLPLISYGGSALIIMLFGMGILLNISKQSRL